MTVDLEVLSKAIPGRSTVTVPIHFRPLEELHYKENITFIVKDSTIRQTISIKGEGIPYKVRQYIKFISAIAPTIKYSKRACALLFLYRGVGPTFSPAFRLIRS